MMSLRRNWYMLACFFYDVRGIESYCSYFKSKAFTCKGCPFLILESEAYKEMVKLAEKKAKKFKEEMV